MVWHTITAEYTAIKPEQRKGEVQTSHRFAALPAWLAKNMTVYRGDNQDPAFIEKIRKLSSQGPDWPRQILSDDGYFVVL